MTAQKNSLEHGRGRRGQRPSDIPRAGWKDIINRVKTEIAEDNLSVVAAGVAFYGFLSIFPALAALVSIYALITDPGELQQHLSGIQSILPAETAQLVNEQLQRIVQSQQATLGWSTAIGLLLALWSAAKGMSALFTAMNVVYDEDETRGFVKLNALALLLTLAAIVFVILFLFVLVGVPLLLNLLPFGQAAVWAFNALRWPLLAIAGIFALAVLYRCGPDRDKPKWRWVSWGAVLATLLWLSGSALFSLYVSNFSSYNATYGSLGVVAVLMTWLLLSAYCILLGAEINSEVEHQTAEDTTEGSPRPMGQRGAYVADTVGS